MKLLLLMTEAGIIQKSAEKSGAVVLSHVINLGKGATLRQDATSQHQKAKHIVVLDADAQHDPADIQDLQRSLANMTLFSATGKKQPDAICAKIRQLVYIESSILLYGISLNDTQSGYRAFSTEAYKK